MPKNLLYLLLGYLCIASLAACRASTPTDHPPSPTPSRQPVLWTASPAPAVLTPTPTPQPSQTTRPTKTQPPATPTRKICLSDAGKIEISQLAVEGLENPLDYRIYLPPCYAQDPKLRYPVLYLVHGQSFNDDQWDRLGADETVDRLVALGEIVPFIIVMPRDTRWGAAEEDPFDEAVLQGLIPHIDEHYLTLNDRRFRAVGGLSRGAGWAANLGLQHPDLFGAVGMHSLALFWSDVSSVKQWLDAIPPELMPRFYVDAGLNDRPDILSSSRWFEKLLNERNIPHEWHLFAGYHDETYWSTHLEQYLRWYAEEW